MENFNLMVNLVGNVAAKKLLKLFPTAKTGDIDLIKISNTSELILTELIGLTLTNRVLSSFNLCESMKRQAFLNSELDVINSPEAAGDFLKISIGFKEQEFFSIACLNSANEVMSYKILFSGTINQAQIYPREIIKHVLKENAAAVVIFHNHPSGNSKPSSDDILLTNKLEGMFKELEIRLHDHIIVSSKNAYSIKGNRYIVMEDKTNGSLT